MFLEIDEMKSVLYSYQMNEIAENDDDIIAEGIEAGVQEVKAYFETANNRRNNGANTKQMHQNWVMYDIDAIFSAQADERNKFVLRLCKTVAAWNICELANVDIIYNHVHERYKNAIRTLERIAGYGDSEHIPLIVSGLPMKEECPDNQNKPKPFRSGSREKFYHE